MRQACRARLLHAEASHQVILGPGHDPLEHLDKPDRKVGGTDTSWRPGDPKEGRKGRNWVSLEPLIACLVRKAWLDPMADLARGLTL